MTLRWPGVDAMLREVLSDLDNQLALGDGYELRIDGLDDVRATIVAVRGDEAMNRLYRFDIVARSTGPHEEALRSSILGRPLHLSMQTLNGGHRTVHGIAAEVQLLARRGDHWYHHFVLVPKLWMATRTVDSRVFQEMTIPVIAAEILRDHSVVSFASLSRGYPTRRYVVQHEETDFDFVRRILAEDGIFFSFLHPSTVEEMREAIALGLAASAGREIENLARSGGSEQGLMDAGRRIAQPSALMQLAEIDRPSEILVLGDTPAAYLPTPGLDPLVYAPTLAPEVLRTDQRHLPLFFMRSSIEPTRATLRDYDPYRAQRPRHGTVIATSSGGLSGALGDLASTAASAGAGLVSQASGEALAGTAVGEAAAGMLGGAGEFVSHGLLTATHAVMAPEVALGRAGLALAGEVLDPLLSETPFSGAASGAAAGVGGAIAGAESGLEIYEHHSAYEEPEATFSMARTELEQRRARAVIGVGSVVTKLVTPGRTIAVTNHDVDSHNRRYAVVAVVHEATGRLPHVYQNEFSCVPDDVPFRPPRPPRRFHQAVESAIVVGGTDQEIDTEALGCVKIQFHWDRRGRHDEHSSCWVRVMQAWAGPGFGFQFVPRVGMEVLVSFVGGDINRPVVIGCMPNLANAPPYHLPQNETRSGIRTQSSPGGVGYNELMFDDAKDHEAVHLRAQRNHEVQVLNDQIVRVGSDRTLIVGENQEMTVGGAQSTRIGADERHHVGGDQGVEIARSASLTIQADRSVSVHGRDSTTIGTGRSVVIGDLDETMVRGSSAGGAMSSHRVDGHYIVAGSRGVTITSTGRIVLGVGASSIVLTKDGITIKGPAVKVVAEDEVHLTTGESTLALKDDGVVVKAPEIIEKSRGASLVLDSNGRLDGEKVLLNCGDRDVNLPPAQAGPPQQGQAQFRIEPPPGLRGPFTLVCETPKGETVELTGQPGVPVPLEGRSGERVRLLRVLDADGHDLAIAPSSDEDGES